VKIVFQLNKLDAQKTENYDNSTHTTNRPVAFAHHLIPWNKSRATRVCEEIRSAAASRSAGPARAERSRAKRAVRPIGDQRDRLREHAAGDPPSNWQVNGAGE